MAFASHNDDFTKRYLIQLDYWGGPHNLIHWAYYTEDAVATVDGSGYIDEQEAIDKLKVGHLIWVYQCVDKDDLNRGIVDISLHAVLANSGTAVDLSDDLLGATVTYGD